MRPIDYKELNSLFLSEYSDYIEKYPIAIDILALPLRFHLLGIYYSFDKVLFTASDIAGVFFYRFYLFLVMQILPVRKKRILTIFNGRFTVISEALALYASKHNIKVESHDNRLSPIKKLSRALLLKEIFIFKIGLSVFARKIIKKIRINSNSDFISINDDILNKLNSSVENDMDYLVRVIKFFNIQEVMCDNDCYPESVILSKAFSKAKVRFTVINHGYISDQSYVGSLPINADMLFVWTEFEKMAIKSMIGCNEFSKIDCIGFPKLEKINNLIKKNIVLCIMAPIIDCVENDAYIESINKIYAIISSFNLDLIIRLHPAERGNKKIVEKLNSCGFALSQRSLLDELSRSRIVIGSYSSALVEAAYNGIPAYQINELDCKKWLSQLKIIPLDNVIKISFIDLIAILAKTNNCVLDRTYKDSFAGIYKNLSDYLNTSF